MSGGATRGSRPEPRGAAAALTRHLCDLYEDRTRERARSVPRRSTGVLTLVPC